MDVTDFRLCWQDWQAENVLGPLIEKLRDSEAVVLHHSKKPSRDETFARETMVANRLQYCIERSFSECSDEQFFADFLGIIR